MSNLTAYTYESTPNINFNDFTDPDNYIKLLFLLLDTEVRNIEDPKIDEGIEDFSSILGKGLLKGRAAVVAEDLPTLNLMIANLKKAMNPRLTQDNGSSDEGYLPFSWTEDIGGTEYDLQVYAKPVEVPRFVKDEKGSGAIVDFLMKIKSPKKYSQDTKVVTLNAASVTGGNTNDGDMPSYPVITITGPTNASPKITNVETGEYMEINDTLAGGEVYVIDCKKATILKDNVNAYGNKTSGSTFFDLNSGAVSLQQDNLGASGVAAIEYRDAWTL